MRFINLLLTSVIAFCVVSCAGRIDVSRSVDELPVIFPDYIGVTVPVNIAPLNFSVEGDAERYAAIFRTGDDSLTVMARDGEIVIPEKFWHAALARAAGDSVSVTVCGLADNEWTAYRAFGIYVSPHAISPYLVYRRLPPLYGTWREMGIYQRELSSCDESAIFENKAYQGNCANCHSFCGGDSEKMLFHLRADGAATYIYDEGRKSRLDTKTDSTIATFTYPYWHPSGGYVAFSVNNIFQIFHTTDPNVTEVIDDASDVVVYDVERNEVFSSPLLKSGGAMETFPAFSPDGATLYFCSAQRPDSLPEQFKDVKYSLCSVSFDAASRSFGAVVDTLIPADAIGASVSMPRPSPDGTKLVVTVSGYGNFPIWHKDADLWMVDLKSGKYGPIASLNSDDVESYHSWSGDSKWMVFSSRREDGLYTRPYFSHANADGTFSRPFLLPQKHPKKYYADLLDSYNIPELVDGKVSLDSRQIVDWIAEPAQKVRYRE